ncbi:hypothetical protein ABPG74_017345 [Tetrahymena malaccensis]
MQEIALLLAKNSVQIAIFLYFHRDNGFDTISSINFMTFFLILVSYFCKQQLARAFNSQMLDSQMLLRIVLTVIVTLLNQTFFVYNLITYTFLVHDLADHIFTICEFYYKKHNEADLMIIPNYKNGFLSIVQIIIAFVVFVKDVGTKELFLAITLAFLEIATKLGRTQLLQLTRVDTKAFDGITISLCVLVHLVIAIIRSIYYGKFQLLSESSKAENPFQDFGHLLIFMLISIVFSYFTNEGLKGQLHLQKRNRYQSAILWILLVINKLVIESKDMEWNTQSLIIIYGILALCELINMESPQINQLIVSSDQNIIMGNVVLNSSNFQGVEVYDKVSLSNFIQHIRRNQDSKKLIFMLSFNFSFMFVELIYGLLSNSLSLISDSAHMLFDSSALAIGLYASFMSKLKPSPTYSYGFERFSTLSGFINGLFLIVVAFDIFTESIERISSPQKVLFGKMMVVSVIGLIINLVGLCFFHEHAHAHGGDDDEGGGCSHSHSHKKTQNTAKTTSSTLPNTQKHTSISQHTHKEGGCHDHEHEHSHDHHDHSHEHDHHHDHDCHDHDHQHDHEHDHHHHDHEHDHHHDHDHDDHHHDHDHSHHHDHDHDHDHEHDHSHGHSHSHGEGHNENLTGVFLHILADALGSVGVIISSILIYYYEWYISDPITSCIISIFIFISVFPLLKGSFTTLLQGYNIKKYHVQLEEIIQKLSGHQDIERYSEIHLWAYTSSNLVFTVKVHIRDIRKRFKVLKEVKKIIKSYKNIKYQTIEIICDKQEELSEISHFSQQNVEQGLLSEQSNNIREKSNSYQDNEVNSDEVQLI